jgi:nitrate/nitrite transporter NarK
MALTLLPDSAAGTVGWMESFGNLVSFALPLIFGAIVAASSDQALGMRLGMILPVALLVLCGVAELVLYVRIQREKKAMLDNVEKNEKK